MKTEIYIATHKAYTFPLHESYIPIHVGKSLVDLDLGIIGDNTGNNISDLNKSFCELTALYWIWKNSNADILGLVHYRRHFSFINDKVILNGKNILDPIELVSLDKNTIIVPTPNTLRKWKGLLPQNVRNQYKCSHYSKDWEIMKKITLNLYPEYKVAFESVERSNTIYFCNMMIAHKYWFDKYCEWLFNILFLCEKEINISNYDDYQKRIFGFMSERLFNIFLHHNSIIETIFLDVVNH